MKRSEIDNYYGINRIGVQSNYKPRSIARKNFHRRPGYRVRSITWKNKKKISNSDYRMRGYFSKFVTYFLDNFFNIFVFIFLFSYFYVLFLAQIEMFIVVAVITFFAAIFRVLILPEKKSSKPRVPKKNLRKGAFYKPLSSSNILNVTSPNNISKSILKNANSSKIDNVFLNSKLKIQLLMKSEEKLKTNYYICSICGSLVEKEDVFCINCGYKLK